MDYQSHYDKLIKRARSRKLTGYVERHHVIPRCMGGDNSRLNMVRLTAREHYLAHLILAKLHPDVPGLWFAVQMMSSGLLDARMNSPVKDARSRNRLYEWVRKRTLPLLVQAGRTAGLGKLAITDGKSIRRITPDTPVPEGWHYGVTYTMPEGGYISLTDGTSNMRIPVGSDIPEGWHEGWAANNTWTKSRRWATDGSTDIRLNRGDAIPKGFHLGRTFKPNKGLICVTDGIHNRRVPKSELNHLPSGWRLGLKFKTGHKGTIRITDGHTNTNINADDAIPDGWRRGMTRHK